MIRNATMTDAAAIALIHVRSWQAAYRGIMPQEHLDSLSVNKRQRMWERCIGEDPQGVLVACDANGCVLGYTRCAASRDPDSDAGELCGIYVDPERYRGGIGSRLISASEERLQDLGFDRVSLWVLEENQIARPFYEKSGYHWDGSRKNETIGGTELCELRYVKKLS